MATGETPQACLQARDTALKRAPVQVTLARELPDNYRWRECAKFSDIQGASRGNDKARRSLLFAMRQVEACFRSRSKDRFAWGKGRAGVRIPRNLHKGCQPEFASRSISRRSCGLSAK